MEIMEELKIEPELEHEGKQRQSWRDYVKRMDRKRIPKQILQYMPWGRRSTFLPRY
jgi:hypothetical protein